jgi:hypothetical protein
MEPSSKVAYFKANYGVTLKQPNWPCARLDIQDGSVADQLCVVAPARNILGSSIPSKPPLPLIDHGSSSFTCMARSIAHNLVYTADLNNEFLVLGWKVKIVQPLITQLLLLTQWFVTLHFFLFFFMTRISHDTRISPFHLGNGITLTTWWKLMPRATTLPRLIYK